MKHAPMKTFGLTLKEEADPVEIVTKSLEDFQKTVDARLKDVETKADTSKIAERLDKLEAKANRPAGGTTATEPAIETKALNTFLRNGAAALDDAEKKSLNWGTPSAGGYVVAPEYSTRIIEKITEFSPMRSLATVTAIGTTEVYIPILTTPISGTWVTETGERQESQPVFDQLKIETFEHAVIVPVSQQLLEDSFIDLQAYLSGQIGQQFGKAEATAFVTGDGNGKPIGFLHDAENFVAHDANLATAESLIESYISLFYKLPTAYAARGAWLMNRKTMGEIRAAADNTTRGLLWSDSLANGQPASFLGRPVYEAPDMPDAEQDEADVYPVAFGDFATAYRIIDRVGVQIMRDDYTGADNGIVKIRARRRVGGRTVQPEALVLMRIEGSGS